MKFVESGWKKVLEFSGKALDWWCQARRMSWKVYYATCIAFFWRSARSEVTFEQYPGRSYASTRYGCYRGIDINPPFIKASFTSKCIKTPHILALSDRFFFSRWAKIEILMKKSCNFFLGYFIAKEHEKMGDRNPPRLGPPRIRKSNFWNHLKMSTFYKKQQWKSLSK